MPETTVIHKRDRLPGDVYIGRPGRGERGPLGSPIIIGQRCPECRDVHEDRGSTIPCFTEYFMRRIKTDEQYRQEVLAARGRRLWCFCKPLPCHGDVIAHWLNTQEEV